ncbi:MAG: peptidase domain-containing ABC transporter [Bacteroidota bacterium]
MFSRYPFHKQLDGMDCGPSCLKMILEFYQKKLHISVLRELCNTSRLGVNIGDIIYAAQQTGLNAIAFKTTTNYLSDKQPLPCIIHWRQNHYVVLYNIRKGKYTIGDPGHGIISLSEKEFAKNWADESEKGIAVLLEPGEEMDNLDIFQNPTHGIVQKFKSILKPYLKQIFYLFLVILVSTAFSFIIPKTIEYMTDAGIEAKQVHIIWKVLLFQFVLFAGITLANYVQSFIQNKLSTRLSIHIISDFLKKLLNLPISFFDTKNHADIYQRIDDHSRIETFLSTKIVTFIFSVSLLVAYTTQLFLFDLYIMLGFVVLTIFSFIWFFLFQKKRQELDYRRFGLAMEERTKLNDLISGMTEVKINNAQPKQVNQWQGLQMKMYDLKLSSLQLTYSQRIGISTINQIKNIVVTFLCAYWVIEEKITFGVMLSVGYIVGQLNVPLQEIMGYFRDYQDARLSFERLNEVQLKEDENNAEKRHFPADFQNGFLLKNVSFKYPGSYNPYVLNQVNLFIPKGKTTAIVGTSGSGKTTLLKLLLAFYHPQEGSILLDDIDLKDIHTDELREQCGVVMQDGYIYNASIAENIALADAKPDLERVHQALQIACLYDFVMSLPQQAETKLGDIGVDMSGGQKQRILIARAVYKNPQIIFFDEATSSLDSNNEKEIMQNLSRFLIGKTVIVIAHRLSTVKNADQIIVLNDGELIEHGSHDQLVRNRSDYYRLIKNQLELGV